VRKPIELPLGVLSGMGQKNRVLDRGPHCRNMANTVERLCKAAMSGSATRCGDAASSQITLGFLVHTRKYIGVLLYEC